MLGKRQLCTGLPKAADQGGEGSRSFPRKESPALPTVHILASQTVFLLTSIPLAVPGMLSSAQAPRASRIPGGPSACCQDKTRIPSGRTGFVRFPPPWPLVKFSSQPCWGPRLWVRQSCGHPLRRLLSANPQVQGSWVGRDGFLKEPLCHLTWA